MTNTYRKQRLAFLVVLFAVALLLLIPEKTYAIAPVSKVLSNTSSGEGATVKDIWTKMMNVVNGLIILVLIVVAFAQILRININTYGVKKILPSLVFAVIAANFSFLFCRLVIDFSNVLCSYLVDGSSSINGFASMFSTNKENLAGLGTPAPEGNIFWYIIGQLLIIAGAVMVYMLAYLLFIRIYILYFLVALGPLAMMAMVLPQTKSLFNQWWSQFLRWTFMPIVSLFWIYLGCRWFSSIQSSGVFLLNYVFAAICFYMALTTPFKLGGSIMNTWGGLGKKAVSPAVDLAKRKAALAWSNQAASENRLNPLGHLARIQTGWQDSKKFDEDRIADNRQKALARVMMSRTGRGRTIAREKMGGDVDMAKEKTLNDYLKTPRGEEWARNRADFLSSLNREKTGKESGLSKGMMEFRKSGDGRKIAEDLLRYQKGKEYSESEIAVADKELVISFNQSKGPFDGNAKNGGRPEDLELANNYFASLARNKTLEEGVNQSSAQRVEAILSDQMYLENIKQSLGKLEAIPKALEKIDTDNDRMRDLEAKKMGGTITAEENVELERLHTHQGNRLERENALKAELSELQSNEQSMRDSARKRYDEVKEQNMHHLDGFIDETSGKVLGFAGSIVGGDDEYKTKLGTTMMTRAGKLMSIEMNADADKLIAQMTPREIGEELINGDSLGRFDFSHVKNFREGKRYLNDPATNRLIEARVLASAKVARQNTNPEREFGREALVTMLDDTSAKSAAIMFNETAAKRNLPDRIDVNLGADQLRSVLVQKMNGSSNVSSVAFASVANQRDVGLSDNPSAYLSQGGGARNYPTGYAEKAYPPAPEITPAEFSTMARSVVMARGQYNPDLANSEQLSKSINQITNALQCERNAIVEQIGRVAGINPNNETFKRTMNDFIMKTQRSDMTPDKIAQAINPIIRQMGGKQISDSTKIEITTTGGKTRQLDLGSATSRAQAASMGVQSAQLIEMQPRVKEIETQIEHFGQMGNKASVDSALTELENALSIKNGVRSNKVPREQINKIANDVIRKVGMGTGVDINFATPQDAIDFLARTRDAAVAASQAYDQDGKFDLKRAQGAAASEYLKRTQR